jgi:hypothetical protein
VEKSRTIRSCYYRTSQRRPIYTLHMHIYTEVFLHCIQRSKVELFTGGKRDFCFSVPPLNLSTVEINPYPFVKRGMIVYIYFLFNKAQRISIIGTTSSPISRRPTFSCISAAAAILYLPSGLAHAIAHGPAAMAKRNPTLVLPDIRPRA